MVKPKKKTIPIRLIHLDPYNIREEEPTDELVESIRKTGQRDPIIIRLGEDGKYYVPDGWQRVQAIARAGYDTVRCIVFSNTIDTLREIERASIQRPWETYQKIKHIKNCYDALTNHRGFSDVEAMQWIVENTSIKSEIWAKRYVEISKLPPLVLTLLKPKNHITEQEWEELKKYSLTIKMKQKVLKPRQVGYISTYLRFVPSERKIQTAVEMLSLSSDESKEFVLQVLEEPAKPPLEIAKEFRYGIEKFYLNPGILIVPQEIKQNVEKTCRIRRIHISQLIEELFELHFKDEQN